MKKFLFGVLFAMIGLSTCAIAQEDSSITTENVIHARSRRDRGPAFANFFSTIFQTFPYESGGVVSFEGANAVRGIELADGTSTNIEFRRAGFYSITYTVQSYPGQTFALFLDGIEILGSEETNLSDSIEELVGQAIIEADRRDILQLRLLPSTSAPPVIALPSVTGTFASIDIVEIAPIGRRGRG